MPTERLLSRPGDWPYPRSMHARVVIPHRGASTERLILRDHRISIVLVITSLLHDRCSCCCTRARAAACPTCSAAASRLQLSAARRWPSATSTGSPIGIGVIWFACIIALGLLLKHGYQAEQPLGSSTAVVPRGGEQSEEYIRGWWQRDPGQPGRRRPDGRGRARRGRAAQCGSSFCCANGHETRPSFADDAAVPTVGLPALRASRPARTARTRRRRRATSRTRRTSPT